MNQNQSLATITNTPSTKECSVVGCTLFEGSYHYGVAALVNSLVRNGYRGIFYAGYRGELPPWAQGEQSHKINQVVSIQFLNMETELHLTYCKPMVINRVFDQNENISAVLYFDPDIVVKCQWAFFERWVEDRVALCMDVNNRLHRSHPKRRDWERYLAPHGYTLSKTTDYYCNAGFIGVSRDHRKFINAWDDLMILLGPETGNRTSIVNQPIDFCFHKMDQDALNVVVDLMPDIVSVMGPEAMDFCEGGYTMSHAVGLAKPWRQGLVWEALCGLAPSKTDKAFFENTLEPIQVYSSIEYAWRLINLRVAAAIGRLIRRS